MKPLAIMHQESNYYQPIVLNIFDNIIYYKSRVTIIIRAGEVEYYYGTDYYAHCSTLIFTKS